MTPAPGRSSRAWRSTWRPCGCTLPYRWRCSSGLIDVGPNLGAINRSALLAADGILIPLAADLFSLQGLRNLGPRLRDWRRDWQRMREVAPPGIPLPECTMRPIGYVVLQHEVRLDRPVKAFKKWLARIPAVYAEEILGESVPEERRTEDDPHCLATLPGCLCGEGDGSGRRWRAYRRGLIF